MCCYLLLLKCHSNLHNHLRVHAHQQLIYNIPSTNTSLMCVLMSTKHCVCSICQDQHLSDACAQVNKVIETLKCFVQFHIQVSTGVA